MADAPKSPDFGDHLFASLPFADVAATENSLTVDLANRPDIRNNRGALQGGLVATLIDVAAGRLADSVTEPAQGVATADMNIHYLAPILDGPARARATIVRAGRRQVVVAVDVTDVGRDRHAARATVSFSILDPR